MLREGDSKWKGARPLPGAASVFVSWRGTRGSVILAF